jgi:uncharacterized protein YaiL (DUF2058 family)
MSLSLKDQLLGLGYKPAPKPEPAPRRPDAPRADGRKPDSRHADSRKPDANRPPNPRSADERKPGAGRPDARRGDNRRPDNRTPQNRKPEGAPRKPRTQEEIDLGKAYALRAQREKDERIEAERLKQEEARVRREAKAKLAELLKDKALNDPNAEIARHFNYGGKIKRVHVNAEQLKALNAGELGVVQDGGRYILVPLALLLVAEAIFAPCVALKVDPNAPAGEDPYSDPAYRVPDDLVW